MAYFLFFRSVFLFFALPLLHYGLPSEPFSMIVLSSNNVMDFMLYGVIDGEEFGLTLIPNSEVQHSV
jgi:hypothetical protein